MMTMKTAIVRSLWALPIALAGCATYTHEYPNHSADQVWNAALAVAESPDYQGEWHVTQNEIWVDDEWARIEVQREIRRLTNAPFTKASPEKRNWQFRITMDSESPVTLAFSNRNPTMPGWTLEEANRYFGEISQLLVAAPEAGILPRKPSPEVKFDEPMPGEANSSKIKSEILPEPHQSTQAPESDRPMVDLFDQP